MTTPPPRRRALGGYGPLVVAATLFLLMAILVPTVDQDVTIENAVASDADTSTAASDDDPGDVPADVAGASTPDSTTTPEGSGAAGTSGGAAGSGDDSTGGGQAAGAGGGSDGGGVNDGPNSGTPQIAGCGTLQVPSDPYSPPCVRFSGNNGGATSRGVTDEEIVVSVRISGFASGYADALTDAAGGKIPDEDEADVRRTLEGLVEYFNAFFQFYGRKIRLEIFGGRGDVLKEMTGGGTEGAQADAIKVSEEIGAFAELAGVTPPYVDALAGRGVLSIGAPFLSRDWLSARAPYAWSQFTDCSTTVESVSSYYATRMGKRPATLAGGALKGTPRRIGIIAPDNSWYQECVRDGVNLLNRAGVGDELVANEKYRLDINSMTTQAASLVPKLKSAGVTTVICGCDPLLLTVLTAKAQEQNYQPEWLLTGLALQDLDLVGSLMQQDQWKRSIGVSFAGPTQARGTTTGYQAYKWARRDEPSWGVDLMYNQLELLAIGIQMAGPQLTPQSFAEGMYRYPTRTGPYGTWRFGAGDHTTSQDAREIYWSPNTTSPATRERGAYIEGLGGRRYPIGQWPAGNATIPGVG